MLISEFTEEAFITSFCIVLSHYPHGKNLIIDRISQRDEAKKGYDGTLHLKNIVYLQFKTSDFFSQNCIGSIRTAREKIVSSRGEEFYSFKLYKKNNYNQHNTLQRLALNNDAFYCAPLFHTKEDLKRFNILEDNNINIDEELNYNKDSLINNTICIKPEPKITDSESHRYSYNKLYDVVFHSEPVKQTENSYLFSNYFNEFINTKRNISFKSILEFMDESYKEDGTNIYSKLVDFYNRTQKKDSNEYLFKKEMSDLTIGIIFENYLKSNFNIIQFCVFSK